MMTIRDAKYKKVITTIDDDGNMIFFDENGQPKPRVIKVIVEDEEDPDASRDSR